MSGQRTAVQTTSERQLICDAFGEVWVLGLQSEGWNFLDSTPHRDVHIHRPPGELRLSMQVNVESSIAKPSRLLQSQTNTKPITPRQTSAVSCTNHSTFAGIQCRLSRNLFKPTGDKSTLTFNGTTSESTKVVSGVGRSLPRRFFDCFHFG